MSRQALYSRRGTGPAGRGRRARASLLLVLTAGAMAACQGAGPDRILSIDATGAVVGVVYLDRNGNGVLDKDDGPVPDIGLRLMQQDLRDTVATVTSSATGTYVLPSVPVGRYRLLVDSVTVPDSLRLISIDSAAVTVGAGDTIATLVRLSYPTASVAGARAAQTGERLFIEGIALNAWSNFGDSTIAVYDTSGTIRAVRMPPVSINAGDSIRVLGTRSSRDGEPVLTNGIAVFLGPAETPPPDSISTATATQADGGHLDAALVRIGNAAITDTLTLFNGDFRMTVDDGSGPLYVLFDHNIRFQLIVHGTDLLVQKFYSTGLLVPNSNGFGWILKPRSNDDILLLAP